MHLKCCVLFKGIRLNSRPAFKAVARQPLDVFFFLNLQEAQTLCRSVQVLLFHYEIIVHTGHPIYKIYGLLEEFGVFCLPQTPTSNNQSQLQKSIPLKCYVSTGK